jgi:hypothetical protein
MRCEVCQQSSTLGSTNTEEKRPHRSRTES